MSYLPAERETVIRTCDEDKTWILYTYQGKIMSKLQRANIEPIETFSDGGARYILDFNQVSFRKKSNGRTMTQEQKDAAAKRLAKARSKRANNEIN